MTELDKPLVSIVIPIYNMGESLKKSVATLQNQDYDNFEILLVDDGSIDNSLDVCNTIAKNDSRVKVFHTENRGSGPARNEGISKAIGKYIYFPDADDIIETNALSVLVYTLESHPECDLAVFGFKSVNHSGTLISEKKYEFAIKNGDDLRKDYCKCMGSDQEWSIQGAPWNKFFLLSVIKDNNIQYPALRRHQDEGFIGRYMCYAKAIVFIPNVLYTYFVNDLERTWCKYPLNYIDSVIGLNEVRKETICRWNPKDIETHKLIKKGYICNIIKSLELAFSPKMPKTASKLEFINDGILKSGIRNLELPNNLRLYHRLAIKLFDYPRILLCLLWIKTLIEKYGLR